MSNDPINITDLRAMLEDDRETEALLLTMFQESVAATLAELKALDLQQPQSENPVSENPARWKALMHKIKGAALNIGATRLADLALHGEHNGDALSAAEKATLLQDISTSYDEIRSFIAGLQSP